MYTNLLKLKFTNKTWNFLILVNKYRNHCQCLALLIAWIFSVCFLLKLTSMNYRYVHYLTCVASFWCWTGDPETDQTCVADREGMASVRRNPRSEGCPPGYWKKRILVLKWFHRKLKMQELKSYVVNQKEIMNWVFFGYNNKIVHR